MTNPATAAPSSSEPSTGSDAPATPAVDAVDIDALKAAAAELATIKASMADQKRADRDARKAAQDEAEKAGQTLQALEAAKARLAELEVEAPLAAKWRAYEAEEAKRLDDEAKTLPDAFKALYGKASDIEGRRDILAAYRSAAGTAAPVKGAPPAMGSPAPVSSADLEAALADKSGAKMAEIKKRDPGAVSAFFAKVLGGKSAAPSSLGIARFSGTAKAPNA